MAASQKDPNMPNLLKEGYLLGDAPGDLKCWPYIRRLITCMGPVGFMSGIYRTGSPDSCERQKLFTSTCLKASVASSDRKQSWVDKAKEELEKIKAKERGDAPDIFIKRRTPPADFHDYQAIIDDAEHRRILAEVLADENGGKANISPASH